MNNALCFIEAATPLVILLIYGRSRFIKYCAEKNNLGSIIETDKVDTIDEIDV